MNHRVFTNLLLAGMLAGAAGALWAQDAPPPPPPGAMQGQVAAEGDAFLTDRIEVLGFGGWLHGGRVVKGAPFSAVAVSETTQTLADGNHISRKSQTNLYRDSLGRVRKEMTITAIGPLAASGEPHSVIEISDPVAGTTYVLEPDQKIARQMPGRLGAGVGIRGGPGGPGDVVYRNFKESTKAAANNESLGTQMIGSVSAEGTRTTRTIAAGEIGNEKPITIVVERWYSADLQMDVKSTRSDPRFGDTTYTLTNILRTEPAASLFTVPSDYTVTTGKGKMFLRRFEGGPETAPPPPPDN